LCAGLPSAAAAQAVTIDLGPAHGRVVLGAGLALSEVPAGLWQSTSGVPSGGQIAAITGDAQVMLPHWLALIGDVAWGKKSYELSLRHGGTTYGQRQSIEALSADVLAGLYRWVGGGHVYLGAGLAIQRVDVEFSRESVPTEFEIEDPIEVELGTHVGVSLGAGLVLPVAAPVVAFGRFRHRLVTGVHEIEAGGARAEREVPVGGPELGIGLGVMF